MTCAGGTPAPFVTISWSLRSLAQLGHQVSVFRVEASFVHDWRWRSVGVFVDLTVASHVARTTANTTNNISCEVALLRTVIFAMSKATAVLADLVLVITEGTVQCGEFAKLVALVIILAFWR